MSKKKETEVKAGQADAGQGVSLTTTPLRDLGAALDHAGKVGGILATRDLPRAAVPTRGRVVDYRLTERDCSKIASARSDGRNWGEPVRTGDRVTAVVVGY